MSSKFNFSQWKINFSQFIFNDKYLKLKKVVYLIHDVHPSLILFKFSFLFSTVNLKLGLSFPHFTLRFKLGFLNLSLRVYFRLFTNSD